MGDPLPSGQSPEGVGAGAPRHHHVNLLSEFESNRPAEGVHSPDQPLGDSVEGLDGPLLVAGQDDGAALLLLLEKRRQVADQQVDMLVGWGYF